jgi:hypothetical protein
MPSSSSHAVESSTVATSASSSGIPTTAPGSHHNASLTCPYGSVREGLGDGTNPTR